MKYALRAGTPIVLTALMTLGAVGAAVGEEREMNLTCWNEVSGEDTTDIGAFAREGLDLTTAGGGTANYSLGFLFDEDSDDEIVCSWLVPGDYDASAGVTPQVTLFGWSTSDASCTIANTGVVRFDVDFRAYASGDSINDAWTDADADNLTWSCDDCGALCYKSDIGKKVTIDAATSDGDFGPLNLVLIRIRRDTSVTDNLDADFHLPRVSIRYSDTL